MPLQNRVDPFGRLVATPEYGTLMGNRGCLHNNRREIVAGAASTTDAWVTCLPATDGPKRQLMRPGWYTELFFLDEATALSAGHRPCGQCRRAAYVAFKTALAIGNAGRIPEIRTGKQADLLMKVDRSRRDAGDFESRRPSDLPDGAMFERGGKAWLKLRDRALEWRFSGYGNARSLPAGSVKVITPRSTLVALGAGYDCTWHESALAQFGSGELTRQGRTPAASVADGREAL